MIEVRFADGSTGDLELTDEEYGTLLDFARRGVKIQVPVGVNAHLFFVDITDIRKVVRPDENIDRAQVSKLGQSGLDHLWLR